jgi:hypothetical protein
MFGSINPTRQLAARANGFVYRMTGSKVFNSVSTALALPSLLGYSLAVAKVYIVSFRTYDDRRPSKFIVLADSMRAAINMAWKAWRG